ncbi:MAG: TRAM domain-containing protein, partial [Leadbetterella sp.]
DAVKYDYGYMFFYSERPGTPAAKTLKDDVPEDVKKERLRQIIEKQRNHCLEKNQASVGKIHRVLVEAVSKKSDQEYSGRNDQNKVVVFPKKNSQLGDYVNVLVTSCTTATLLGEIVS